MEGFLRRIIEGRYDIRYDLDQCCRWEEYNRALGYAEKYMDVKGMKEACRRLIQAGDDYKKDIAETVDPQRNEEERKYGLWRSWNRFKNICKSATICFGVSTVLTYIAGIVAPVSLQTLSLLFLIFAILALPVFLVAKAGELVCGRLYDRFLRPIKEKIAARNFRFAEESRGFYDKMDNLYLNSLDPSHREMVLMHREQVKHMEKMERMEQERQQKEKELLQEQRKARKAQESLLAIEEERERRYGHR